MTMLAFFVIGGLLTLASSHPQEGICADGTDFMGETGCRSTNNSSEPVCSGRGVCICGVCECNKLPDPEMVISGQYCECDNFSCTRVNGLLCSGPDRGVCACGKCACRAGYHEDPWGGCSCPDGDSTCRSPDTGDICSGHGKCVCGRCECDTDGIQPFSGRYCESCPTCPSKCGEFRDCVECVVHSRGVLYNPDATVGQRCAGCTIAPIVVEGPLEANDSLGEHMCKFYNDKDCLLVYSYYRDDYWRLIIRAQKELKCPEVSGSGINQFYNWSAQFFVKTLNKIVHFCAFYFIYVPI